MCRRKRGANLEIKIQHERIKGAKIFLFSRYFATFAACFSDGIRAAASAKIDCCRFRLRPDGGIGRRAGLKHLWETVPVRLRLRVQNRFERSGFFVFILFL